MNYRHLFHAGNFADVHKHVVLIALLDHLLKKTKPIFFLDTHAGRGDYNLKADEALRGNESQTGIGRLLQAQPRAIEIQHYLRLIQDQRISTALASHYPGSPLIAARLLRSGDRRVFVEKHPEEATALRASLRGARDTSIVEDDAYHALQAYLPPKENRGLALIDPPYEAADEFKQLQKALIAAANRWPNGVYCVWYPLKLGSAVQTLHAGLQRSGLRKLLVSEVWIRPLDSSVGLNGSGLLILNPPWQMDERLETVGEELAEFLAEEGLGGARVAWLVRE